MRKIATVVVGFTLAVLLTGTARGAWEFERLTDNSGDSKYPDPLISGTNRYVVWQDDTYGNYEIFSKTGP